MTSADPFTRASPHYVAAMRTCDRQGDAFEVSGGNITGLLSGCAALIVFAFAVGFAGYCIWAIVTHPWGG